MQWSIDGDQICVTRDDFTNLQESPAVFVPRASLVGGLIEHFTGLLLLPMPFLRTIIHDLQSQWEERNGQH